MTVDGEVAGRAPAKLVELVTALGGPQAAAEVIGVPVEVFLRGAAAADAEGHEDLCEFLEIEIMRGVPDADPDDEEEVDRLLAALDAAPPLCRVWRRGQQERRCRSRSPGTARRARPRPRPRSGPRCRRARRRIRSSRGGDSGDAGAEPSRRRRRP